MAANHETLQHFTVMIRTRFPPGKGGALSKQANEQ